MRSLPIYEAHRATAESAKSPPEHAGEYDPLPIIVANLSGENLDRTLLNKPPARGGRQWGAQSIERYGDRSKHHADERGHERTRALLSPPPRGQGACCRLCRRTFWIRNRNREPFGKGMNLIVRN
jgi:hypothetical protein